MHCSLRDSARTRTELPAESPSLSLSRIPPPVGGIHLSNLSDFPGPPQLLPTRSDRCQVNTLSAHTICTDRRRASQWLNHSSTTTARRIFVTRITAVAAATRDPACAHSPIRFTGRKRVNYFFRRVFLKLSFTHSRASVLAREVSLGVILSFNSVIRRVDPRKGTRVRAARINRLRYLSSAIRDSLWGSPPSLKGDAATLGRRGPPQVVCQGFVATPKRLGAREGDAAHTKRESSFSSIANDAASSALLLKNTAFGGTVEPVFGVFTSLFALNGFVATLPETPQIDVQR